MAFSFNLTDGTSRRLTDEECGWFDVPLWLNDGAMIVEVVLWSPPFNAWIHLVRARTERVFPPGELHREVAVEELGYYASWFAGEHACPECGGNSPASTSHQPGCTKAPA